MHYKSGQGFNVLKFHPISKVEATNRDELNLSWWAAFVCRCDWRCRSVSTAGALQLTPLPSPHFPDTVLHFCGPGLTISNKFVDSTKFHLLSPMSCIESNLGQQELLPRKADNKELRQRKNWREDQICCFGSVSKSFFLCGPPLWLWGFFFLPWFIFWYFFNLKLNYGIKFHCLLVRKLMTECAGALKGKGTNQFDVQFQRDGIVMLVLELRLFNYVM